MALVQLYTSGQCVREASFVLRNFRDLKMVADGTQRVSDLCTPVAKYGVFFSTVFFINCVVQGSVVQSSLSNAGQPSIVVVHAGLTGLITLL